MPQASATPASSSTPPEQPAPRVVDDQEKALVSDWNKRIEASKKRHSDQFKTFEVNRKLLRGRDENGKKIPANLYFANLATMRPQVYAKDPEYSVTPSRGVSQERLQMMKKFGETSEAVLTKVLVQDANLKKRAKRQLTSAYTTSVGWLKACWQESPQVDPLITDKIKDTQDNLALLQAQREALDDPSIGNDTDLKIAQLNQTLQGLQSQTEVSVARGLALDFCLSEDVLCLDESVREFSDYLRSSALAHRVWFTRDKYKATFGYKPEKGKSYTEQSGQINPNGSADQKADLLCVWEIWEQDSNRVFTVCEGEEGFCKPPFSPDWTGKRWYPFFGLAFNEIEGSFYPLSDIELTQESITEINETARDFIKDRKDARPINIVRKGGSLTPDDVEKIRNRNGTDLIMVEGVGGQPIANDIYIGSLAQLKPEVYDTTVARSFMEQIIGGGDANRGTVTKAKTATEAEILNQGIRSRSSERQDTMEDLLTDLGQYALQICLRKLSKQEVQQIAGADAEWPELNIDQIFDQITLEVRGGSTGKPNELQEQDRWTKLLPVIEKTIEQVSELRMKGQEALAQALIELTRETLRRFDERLDIEEFLPPAAKDGQPDPAQLTQENAMLKQQMQEMTQQLHESNEKLAKGYISAAAVVATSLNPQAGAAAFGVTLRSLESADDPQGQAPLPNAPMVPAGPAPIDPAMVEQLQQQVATLEQQLMQHEADGSKEIEKARINAHRDIEVTKVKAPIEAHAKVESARITAEANAAAKPPEAEKPDPVHKSVEDLAAQVKELHAHVSKPKGASRLVHKRGPDGRISESVLMPATE